jgi:hypothetical protein
MQGVRGFMHSLCLSFPNVCREDSDSDFEMRPVPEMTSPPRFV